jgi:hypothetical protein
VVSRYGILWSIPLMGVRAVILPFSITSLLAVALFASLAGLLLWLRRIHWLKSRRGECPLRHDELSLRETCVLVLPFSAAYFCLLLPRAAFSSLFSDVYDRYYLPLVLMAVILLLRLLKERQRELPLSCYAVLLLFSFFSIAATHDMFCSYRAVASVRARLVSTGIAPSQISGPWEEDGVNQINAAGYINDDRLENPPGAYHPAPHPPLEDCAYWFGPLLPALHFQYMLTVDKLTCVTPSQFPDVTYTTWLAPFHRTIHIERVPEPR